MTETGGVVVHRLGNYVYTPEEGRVYSEQLFKFIADGTLKINIHA